MCVCIVLSILFLFLVNYIVNLLFRVLSELSDMLVVHGIPQWSLLKLGESTTIPIFPASCNIYSLQKVLSDFMTFQEIFNKLEGLTIAYVGPPTPVFNSYLLLCPLFGIKIQYLCICVVSITTTTTCTFNSQFCQYNFHFIIIYSMVLD